MVDLPESWVFFGFSGGIGVKDPLANAGDAGDADSIPGSENPSEKGMATCSSTLAWKIPRAEKPGILQSTGSQTAGSH